MKQCQRCNGTGVLPGLGMVLIPPTPWSVGVYRSNLCPDCRNSDQSPNNITNTGETKVDPEEQDLQDCEPDVDELTENQDFEQADEYFGPSADEIL